MLIATITSQRSGSKLLASHFNCGTAARSYGEVFYPTSDTVGSFHSFVQSKGFSTLMRQHADATLDQFFSALTLNGRIPAHFDLMFNQLDIPCLSFNPYYTDFIYGYLRARRAVVVSLERSPRDMFMSKKASFENRVGRAEGSHVERVVTARMMIFRGGIEGPFLGADLGSGAPAAEGRSRWLRRAPAARA